MICSKKALADIFGVTGRTITDWEQAGMPIESRPGRGISNQYDSAQCVEWRTQRVLGNERHISPRDRKDLAHAEILELRLQKESERIIDVADIEPQLENMILAARRHFEQTPLALKSMLDKKYGIDVDLKLLKDRVAETLTIMSENAPQLGIDKDGHYFNAAEAEGDQEYAAMEAVTALDNEPTGGSLVGPVQPDGSEKVSQETEV